MKSYLFILMCTGHVGGLLALFLGASAITCLELIDGVAHRCLSVCTRTTRPTQHRKRCRRKSNWQHGADANHVHFRSVDDVTADALAVANHADARRSVLKSPSPLPTSNVSPCSGRLVNTNTTSTQRSSMASRSVLRPSPLAETDI